MTIILKRLITDCGFHAMKKKFKDIWPIMENSSTTASVANSNFWFVILI